VSGPTTFLLEQAKENHLGLHMGRLVHLNPG
jgi:hypothetical protein